MTVMVSSVFLFLGISRPRWWLSLYHFLIMNYSLGSSWRTLLGSNHCWNDYFEAPQSSYQTKHQIGFSPMGIDYFSQVGGFPPFFGWNCLSPTFVRFLAFWEALGSRLLFLVFGHPRRLSSCDPLGVAIGKSCNLTGSRYSDGWRWPWVMAIFLNARSVFKLWSCLLLHERDFLLSIVCEVDLIFTVSLVPQTLLLSRPVWDSWSASILWHILVSWLVTVLRPIVLYDSPTNKFVMTIWIPWSQVLRSIVVPLTMLVPWSFFWNSRGACFCDLFRHRDIYFSASTSFGVTIDPWT